MAERPEVTRTETAGSAVLRKGEYGYPNGHLGHLDPQETKALEEFKELCTEKNTFYKPATDTTPSTHDDVTLLRFLRARRFIPQEAYQQFHDTETWRAKNEIDNLYENIDVEEYEETRKLYPQWTGRRDKRGLPVYVFEIAPLNSKTMSAYAKSATSTTVLGTQDMKDKDVPPRLYRLFALYENLTTFILPYCSQLRDRPTPATPISQSNNIVDISGVGLKQFWNLRSHMQDASVLATAHYPETLDRIFIVGAPSFFPTVWSWIKRWFDPITTSKIFILSEHTAFKTLSQFIDADNIPKKYGGTLEWAWGSTPLLDGKEDHTLTWKEGAQAKWPKGPVKWVTHGDGTWDFVAIGSVDGKIRRDTVASFKPDPVPVEEQLTEPTAALETPDRAFQDLSVADSNQATNGSVLAKKARDDSAAPNGTENNADPALKVELVSQEAVIAALPEQTGEESAALKA